MALKYRGQALQDKFVVCANNNKKNGVFVEIGSNDPIVFNNTYVLEKNLDWTGIMVEFEGRFLSDYKINRPKSTHVIMDATKIDYKKLFEENNIPNNVDYLQIDLDVNNRTTLTTLEIMNRTVFDNYRFAAVTFEHDMYNRDPFNTRLIARQIFSDRGYVLVFPDVMYDNNAFEDWYVHPDLVNMDYINKIKTTKSLNYQDISEILDIIT